MKQVFNLIVLFSVFIVIGCATKCQNIPQTGEKSMSNLEVKSKNNLDVSKMKDWVIVVPPDSIPSEKYAGEEFQRLFKEATDIMLSIKDEAKSHCIYIGQAKGLSDNLDDEELLVIVKENSITITGGRPRGVLYGVYQFFEDAFGVRFLTFDHTHIPKVDNLKIPIAEIRYNPPFSFRWSYYNENYKDPAFATRLRVNTITNDEKLGGKTPQNLIGHSVGWLLPFDKYGAEHPEYYALFEGKRDTNTDAGGPQLCVTNEDVIEEVAKNAISILDQHPDMKNIPVSQADTARYCHCENCEKINQAEGTPMGSNLAFVNAVAERIEKKYPNVKIGTLAYWYTRKAPKTIKPRHNVQIQLCSIECCTLHPIDDPKCDRNKEFCQDMNDWSAICNDIWIWNYNTNFRYYDLPFPNLRVIGPNVRYFLRNSAKGVFMQANGNGLSGELSDLRNYLMSRILWNPNLDDKAVLEEFVRLHYRSSAQPILDYINMFHDNAEQKGLNPGCFPLPADLGLDPEMCQKIMAYFNKALELADDDIVKARVEKASICAYRAMIEAGGEIADRDAVIDRYIDLCKRYNMTMAAETIPAETFFEQLKKK
ncbi:TPA: DUF4838 domain-containing protein [bacterium]|nr:DUF4838 domain-containing protein [bacterium]